MKRQDCNRTTETRAGNRLKPFLLGTFVSLSFFALPATLWADNFLESLELGKDVKIVDVSKQLPSLAGSFLAAQAAGNDGDDPVAIERYRRAIELDKDNVTLKQSMFLALTANGDIGEAIKLLNDIPAESQDDNVDHIVVAANALKQKSWSQALARIDRIEGRDIDQMMATVFGAWALFGDRKIDAAVKRLEDLKGPDWIELIREYHAGLILAAAGRDQDAIARLTKAVGFRSASGTLNEAYARAVDALARVKAHSGDIEGAMEAIRDGLDILAIQPALTQLEAALEAGEGSKIAPLITTATQGGAEIFFNLGTAIGRQGGNQAAQAHLQIAHFLAPESDVISFSLGNVYSDRDKYAIANGYYETVKETSPYLRRAQLETAINLNRLDETPQAVAILERLTADDPLDMVSVLTLGSLHSQQDDFEKAIAVYSATIDRLGAPNRGYWPLFYRRGIAYERVKKWPLAEADFKTALELSPEQADVLNYLGYSWIDQGIHLDEGLEMVKKAVDLRPNSGFIIDSLGWAYYRLGRYEDAVKELERALVFMPSDPVINDHLGDAYWQTGRHLEATFQWKHSLAGGPTDEDRAKIERKLQSGLTN
ncbi:MAG: tetratricopeptide repeat protein [Nitratireductor sp.]|nr:tetratricopeptide repeat protein [Nitratireductor sp.]